MKAEIKKGLIILIPETKKEMRKVKKLIKRYGASDVIPATQDLIISVI